MNIFNGVFEVLIEDIVLIDWMGLHEFKVKTIFNKRLNCFVKHVHYWDLINCILENSTGGSCCGSVISHKQFVFKNNKKTWIDIINKRTDKPWHDNCYNNNNNNNNNNNK